MILESDLAVVAGVDRACTMHLEPWKYKLLIISVWGLRICGIKANAGIWKTSLCLWLDVSLVLKSWFGFMNTHPLSIIYKFREKLTIFPTSLYPHTCSLFVSSVRCKKGISGPVGQLSPALCSQVNSGNCSTLNYLFIHLSKEKVFWLNRF